MKKLNYILLTALAALSTTAFAQSSVALGDTSVKYDVSEFGTSAVKQEVIGVSQDLSVYAVPVSVSIKAGRSNHDTVSSLSVATSKTYLLADNGWTVAANATLATGAVRNTGDALWIAGTNFDVTKSTTMLDVSATSAYPLVRERSVDVNLLTGVSVAQGLESFTTNYHPTAFKNGLELMSKTSLGTVVIKGVYSQFNGNKVAVDTTTEYSIGFDRKDWGVQLATVNTSNHYKSTSIGVNYKF